MANKSRARDAPRKPLFSFFLISFPRNIKKEQLTTKSISRNIVPVYRFIQPNRTNATVRSPCMEHAFDWPTKSMPHFDFLRLWLAVAVSVSRSKRVHRLSIDVVELAVDNVHRPRRLRRLVPSHVEVSWQEKVLVPFRRRPVHLGPHRWSHLSVPFGRV